MEQVTMKQSIKRHALKMIEVCNREGEHLNGDEIIYIAMLSKHILEETCQDYSDHSMVDLFRFMIKDNKRMIFNCRR